MTIRGSVHMLLKKQGDFRQTALLLIGLSVTMGLIYGLNLPRFVDAAWATVPWGITLVLLGIIVLYLRMTGHKTSLCLLYVSLGLITLLQIPPVVLWFVFDGQGVGEYGATPVGHWAWSTPHIILALLALYLSYILRSKANDFPQ